MPLAGAAIAFSTRLLAVTYVVIGAITADRLRKNVKMVRHGTVGNALVKSRRRGGEMLNCSIGPKIGAMFRDGAMRKIERGRPSC
ncbi:hypothetical protein LQ948_09165 [Jiella sp. MQZ9-1]|uniref:Uncharacterized protein n=1 Tax=Jiella flava TaxID=2816857 RepID=A0A939FWM0_9HYPH|nr:hypothetical protein [Jiella flava]MBO0662862.1 hypothetical protein [Jiella flava]MCD2471378.1 hypothetical protein [Jiella flava]